MKYPLNATSLTTNEGPSEEFGRLDEFLPCFRGGCILDRLNHCLSGAVVDTDLAFIIDKSQLFGHICQRPIDRQDDPRLISCLSSKLASQAHQPITLNDKCSSAIDGLVGGLE